MTKSKLSGNVALWPVHLKPQDDELLSSWLSRLANTYSLSLPSFCDQALPKRLLKGDVDVTRNLGLLKILAKSTGTPIDRVADTSLLAYEGYLFEYTGYAEHPWFIPIDSTPRKQRSGLQFCPRCLLEDEKPYFRRQWRLACVTLCEKHSVSLLDRCSHCGSCISLTRQSTYHGYKNEVVLCPACKLDIRVASLDLTLSTVAAEDVKFQEYLMGVLKQGWVEIPGSDWVYSHAYFKVLYTLMYLLTVEMYAQSFRKTVCSYLNVPLVNIALPEKFKCLERLGVNERRGVLRLSKLLLQDWPNKFISLWEWDRPPSHYQYFQRLNPNEDIPFWFWSVLHDYVVKPRYRESNDEFEARYEYIYRKVSEGEDYTKLVEWLDPPHMLRFVT